MVIPSKSAIRCNKRLGCGVFEGVIMFMRSLG